MSVELPDVIVITQPNCPHCVELHDRLKEVDHIRYMDIRTLEARRLAVESKKRTTPLIVLYDALTGTNYYSLESNTMDELVTLIINYLS